MAEFEDNAVVTAEDLNNIAVDLGDTTFSAFSDEKFGVDRLNEITADIVSKGVLNIGNKCEAVLDSGVVYIQTGVIVFESGAKIRITSPVGIEASAGDYIYAFNDVTTGRASIQTSAEYPSSGDYVMLAQIKADGTVADMRHWSVAKVEMTSSTENKLVTQMIEEGDGSVIAVEPLFPACRLLWLTTFGGELSPTSDILGLACVLTEEYQVIARYATNYFTPYLSVKMKDGLLYFKIHVGNTMPKLEFILA